MNEFDDLSQDASVLNQIYMLSIAATLSDVTYKLSAIRKVLAQRPDLMPTEVSFELSALIQDFLTSTDKLLMDEVKRLLAEDPSKAETLRAYGIDPDDL